MTLSVWGIRLFSSYARLRTVAVVSLLQHAAPLEGGVTIKLTLTYGANIYSFPKLDVLIYAQQDALTIHTMK